MSCHGEMSILKSILWQENRVVGGEGQISRDPSRIDCMNASVIKSLACLSHGGGR